MSQPYALFAFDFDLMRPGCVIIQRLLGGGKIDGSNPASDFPSESWVVSITPGMKLYSIETEQMYLNIVDNYDAMVAYHESKKKV